MVSLRLSPLDTLDEDSLMLMTSAESRLAASSNDDCVLVEGSMKTLMTVRPRRVGTFLMERDAISRKPSLSLKRFSMSETLRSSMEMRCMPLPFRSHGTRLKGSCCLQDCIAPRPASHDRDSSPPRRPAGPTADRSERYSSITTSSMPSVSTRCTTTLSLRLVGTFLPTKSGRIGRSRWPLSTSTARRTACGLP